MNELYFKNIIQVGDLYLDYVFFEFELEPILFTCTDSNKNLYLCLCSDIRFGQKWLVCRCSIRMLHLLLEKRIDIASGFLSNDDIIIITLDLQENENSYIIRKNDIDRLDLPEEGTYIQCDQESMENYLLSKEYEHLNIQRKQVLGLGNIVYETSNSYHEIFRKKIDGSHKDNQPSLVNNKYNTESKKGIIRVSKSYIEKKNISFDETIEYQTINCENYGQAS